MKNLDITIICFDKSLEQKHPLKRACVKKWPISEVNPSKQTKDYDSPTPPMISLVPPVLSSDFIPTTTIVPSVVLNSINQEEAKSMQKLSLLGLIKIISSSSKNVCTFLVASPFKIYFY